MVSTVQDVFEDLIKERNFGEVVLVAWAYTEYMINHFMFQRFGPDKEGRKFISNIEFDDKWNYLKKCKLFTEVEKEKITAFQNKRNRLFHFDLFNEVDYYSSEGREKTIKLARESFYAVVEAFKRNNPSE